MLELVFTRCGSASVCACVDKMDGENGNKDCVLNSPSSDLICCIFIPWSVCSVR